MYYNLWYVWIFFCVDECIKVWVCFFSYINVYIVDFKVKKKYIGYL